MVKKLSLVMVHIAFKCEIISYFSQKWPDLVRIVT